MGREAYVAELQERTRDLPVEWCGAFAPHDLPAILSAADVLVLPSRCDESYSRVVREARAAGLAVVAPTVGGPADVLRHEVDALLVPPDSLSALAAALQRLVDDPTLLARLQAAPASFPTVVDGVARLEDVFARALASRGGRAVDGEPRPRVSVAYVTKNGAQWLDGSLRAVRLQRGPFELLEILAVDSGSTDGSLDILARHDVRTVRIAPSEFGHGKTRNLAVREARGDLVVFLTQDASPANDGWLAPLVAALVADPLLAGVWSRHAPRPGCHPMEWRNLVEFPLFQGIEATRGPRVATARGNPDYALHPEQYYWFSNNSSAFRREVLLRWPFPVVEFAEDQAWARQVLEAGFRTALLPDSLILHSHAYSAWTNLQRNFDHARAMTQDLGQTHSLTLADALRAALRETRRDVAFWAGFRQRTRLRVTARWGAPALAYHLGAFGGRWLGLRAARLPAGVMGRLSLYERLRAGQ
jgi:rhamnosyltransferase